MRHNVNGPNELHSYSIVLHFFSCVYPQNKRKRDFTAKCLILAKFPRDKSAARRCICIVSIVMTNERLAKESAYYTLWVRIYVCVCVCALLYMHKVWEEMHNTRRAIAIIHNPLSTRAAIYSDNEFHSLAWNKSNILDSSGLLFAAYRRKLTNCKWSCGSLSLSLSLVRASSHTSLYTMCFPTFPLSCNNKPCATLTKSSRRLLSRCHKQDIQYPPLMPERERE